MEKEGLHRSIEFLKGRGLDIAVLVIDIHKLTNGYEKSIPT